MRIRPLHRWDLAPREAAALQFRLRSRLRLVPFRGVPRFVAGADLAFHPAGRAGRRARTAWGCVILYRVEPRGPAFRLVEAERASAEGPLRFPYVPGLLSFREGPILLEAFRKLRQRPDLVFFDAHGTAHPRGFGEACHLGLWLGLPSIGVAKSVLVGEARDPGRRAGCSSRLILEGRTVGAALRTQDGVKPVYVSPGHRVDLESAVRLALACAGPCRVPIPTRGADLWSKELRRARSEEVAA